MKKPTNGLRPAAGTALVLLVCSCNTLTPPTALPAGPDPVRAAKETRRPQLTGTLPVVMLLVDEKSLGTIPTAEVETLGLQQLGETGYRTVDQDMIRSNIEQRQKLLKAAGDNRAAAALGLQYGAEVMLIGEAVCKPAAQRIAETSLRAYQAVATLRAVRTDNGTVIASASETGTSMDIEDVRGSSKALKAAAQACFDKLIPATGQAWMGGGPAGHEANAFKHHLEITVGGMDQLWKVKAVRDALRGMAHTKEVVQRNYTAGAAVFDINSSKPAEELAEELVLKPPQGLKMQVLSIESGKITLRAAASS